MKLLHFTTLALCSAVLIACKTTPSEEVEQQAKVYISNVLTDTTLYSVDKTNRDGSSKSTFGITYSDIQPLPVGAGAWISVAQTGANSDKFDWRLDSANGPQVLHRDTNTEFGRGVAFVINNTDLQLTGNSIFSFEYFSKDADPSTPNKLPMLSYRVWGVPSESWDGIFQMTAGNGEWAAAGASKANIPNAKDLVSKSKLGIADDWKKVEVTADVTGMQWIFVSFGHTFREKTVDKKKLEQYLGIRNVFVPSP
ncbi:hypothetical protein [Echinimonas agarilytica]|uniref:Uncharacterized protein n=1 Tax=Echinimonas agarilytica TaxID=1215918 RepID=A0AA41W640_9GAMM|nr:hypothetical protein [Echinimonas agarilytica]MCM2679382.1 hypothetical protein [Echinimonas agarilytica]